MSQDNKAYNNILELIGNTPLIKLNKITEGFLGTYYTKYEDIILVTLIRIE